MSKKTKIMLLITLITSIILIATVYLDSDKDIHAESSTEQVQTQNDENKNNSSLPIQDKKSESLIKETEKTETESEISEKDYNNQSKTDDNKTNEMVHYSSDYSDEIKGHYEERQVLVKDAYDEQVLVKKGECTQVLVQDAYDTQELVYLDGAYFNGDPVEVAVCNDCGAIFYDSSVVDHITNSPNCGGWHNEVIDTCEPYWHNVEYKTVHHDAVYETRCEPDVYETVHHEAVYETQKVWVED